MERSTLASQARSLMLVTDATAEFWEEVVMDARADGGGEDRAGGAA